MTVEIVGITTLVGAIAIVLIAWFIATRRPITSIDDVRPSIYRVRRGYFFAITAVLTLGLLGTIPRRPYAKAESTEPAMTIVADGVMWSWLMENADPERSDELVVPVGRPVTFDVGALDVNHNFAVYHPDGSLLGQVQAMPGYRNRLTLTFPVAGTYPVLCLEYCGLGHHVMANAIEAR